MTVPTLAERQGDFSGDGECYLRPDALRVWESMRKQAAGAVQREIERDPAQRTGSHRIGGPQSLSETQQRQRIQQLQLHDVGAAPGYQFDIKIDHQFNDRNRISGRYSRGWSNFTTPLTLGDGFDNDGIKSGVTVAQNASLEYTRTINPRIIWTSHVGVDRVHELSLPGIPTISSFNASLPAGVQGLPSVFPTGQRDRQDADVSDAGKFAWTNLYDQCCINTTFAHTLVSYSSQLVISKGAHLIKARRRAENFLQQFLAAELPDRLHDLYG